LWFLGVARGRFPLVQRIEMSTCSKTRSIRRDRVHMDLKVNLETYIFGGGTVI
jgi:hypothetical protein